MSVSLKYHNTAECRWEKHFIKFVIEIRPKSICDNKAKYPKIELEELKQERIYTCMKETDVHTPLMVHPETVVQNPVSSQVTVVGLAVPSYPIAQDTDEVP